jgi:hypothetical protein
MLEGLAIGATHELLPELRACAKAEQRVGAQLRELMTANDPDELDRYFSPDWLRDARDVPAKVGY